MQQQHAAGMRPAATRRPVAARAEEESKSGGLVLGKKTFMEPSDSVIKGREQRAREADAAAGDEGVEFILAPSWAKLGPR